MWVGASAPTLYEKHENEQRVGAEAPTHMISQFMIIEMRTPLPNFGLVFADTMSYKHIQTRRRIMKRIACVLAVYMLFLCTSALAGIKPCEELKGEIEEKLKAKGVTNYTLEIVPTDQIKDEKVVGSCDGGKMKITYTKEKEEKKAK
jgi:hypothetical protein